MTDSLHPTTFDSGFLVLFRGDAEYTRFTEYIPELCDQGDDAFDVFMLSDSCGIVCMNRWDCYDSVTELHAYLEEEHGCDAVHVALPNAGKGVIAAVQWLSTVFGWDNLTLHKRFNELKTPVETYYDDEFTLVSEDPEVPSSAT